MGAHDVIDALQPLVRDPAYRDCVEWLGTAWGHAVAPSTPPDDFRRHVTAWQTHFAAIFGVDALRRVRGFSPPEMALPNEPDACYGFVSTLNECGYRWVLFRRTRLNRSTTGSARAVRTFRTGWSRATPPAKASASSRSSRRAAATPNSSPRCSLTTKRGNFSPWNSAASRPATGHADR